MLPAARTEEQVRQSALREMIRQLNREFVAHVENYKFNKRALIWSPLSVEEE